MRKRFSSGEAEDQRWTSEPRGLSPEEPKCRMCRREPGEGLGRSGCNEFATSPAGEEEPLKIIVVIDCLILGMGKLRPRGVVT